MKLGYAIPNNQGFERIADIVELAVLAEQLGYNSGWVSEHLFHASYVAKRLGNKPYHDPLTILTAVACATQTLRLGTSVLVLPWHHPVRLGKTMATLDHLSLGRVDLGVGVAVTEDEFENLGVEYSTRGQRTDDILAALQALWQQDVPAYKGKFYQFQGQRFEPKPLQSPLPIHVGGGSPAALRRVVKFGQGWHALGKSPLELKLCRDTLALALQKEGREIDSVWISIRCVVEIVDAPFDRPYNERRTLKGTETEIVEVIRAFQATGVNEIVLDPNSPDMDTNRNILERVQKIVKSELQ